MREGKTEGGLKESESGAYQTQLPRELPFIVRDGSREAEWGRAPVRDIRWELPSSL